MQDVGGVFMMTKTESIFYMMLSELHYLKLYDFINDNEHLSLREIAYQIYKTEDSDALIDLCFVLKREAVRTNRQRETSKIMLVYYLNEYKINWTRKTKSIENRMAAFCLLRNLFSDSDDSYEEKIKKIWDYLEFRIPPQYYWIPNTPNDPIITEVFDKIWPLQ